MNEVYRIGNIYPHAYSDYMNVVRPHLNARLHLSSVERTELASQGIVVIDDKLFDPDKLNRIAPKHLIQILLSFC